MFVCWLLATIMFEEIRHLVLRDYVRVHVSLNLSCLPVTLLLLQLVYITRLDD